jgi:adenosylcobinamide-GDP ribazoletransferase
MRSFGAALQFLTVIPVPRVFDDEDLARSPVWFPVIGLLIGGVVAAVDVAMARLAVPVVVSCVLDLAVLAGLHGGLHLDGLADTGDGFLSARPRERVLEIMRDSRIGTMGVLALVFVLALKGAGLVELTSAGRWRALLLAPLAGRAALLVVMNLLPYARENGGLAAVFIRHRHRGLAIWAVLWLIGGTVILLGWEGLWLAAAVVIVTALLCAWSWRRIGGFTGDTLGATSEVVEAVAIVCAACQFRWS